MTREGARDRPRGGSGDFVDSVTDSEETSVDAVRGEPVLDEDVGWDSRRVLFVSERLKEGRLRGIFGECVCEVGQVQISVAVVKRCGFDEEVDCVENKEYVGPEAVLEGSHAEVWSVLGCVGELEWAVNEAAEEGGGVRCQTLVCGCIAEVGVGDAELPFFHVHDIGDPL